MLISRGKTRFDPIFAADRLAIFQHPLQKFTKKRLYSSCFVLRKQEKYIAFEKAVIRLCRPV